MFNIKEMSSKPDASAAIESAASKSSIVKAQVKAEQRKIFKAALMSPYQPQVEPPKDEVEVINLFKTTFAPSLKSWTEYQFKKRAESSSQRKRKQAEIKSEDEIKQEAPSSTSSSSSESRSHASFFPDIVIGLNAVSRSLESGRASAVAFSSKLPNPMMWHHLPSLCHIASTPSHPIPLCMLTLTSEEIGTKFFGLPSCAAFAIIKPDPSSSSSSSPNYHSLVAKLQEKCTPVSMPWLPHVSSLKEMQQTAHERLEQLPAEYQPLRIALKEVPPPQKKNRITIQQPSKKTQK